MTAMITQRCACAQPSRCGAGAFSVLVMAFPPLRNSPPWLRWARIVRPGGYRWPPGRSWRGPFRGLGGLPAGFAHRVEQERGQDPDEHDAREDDDRVDEPVALAEL